MDENLEDDRPLTEEERRENLRKLLGEDKADDYFYGVPPSSGDSLAGVRSSSVAPESASLVNWRLIGIFGLIFVLVLIAAAYVTSEKVQEETVDTPTSVVPQNGGDGVQPTR